MNFLKYVGVAMVSGVVGAVVIRGSTYGVAPVVGVIMYYFYSKNR